MKPILDKPVPNWSEENVTLKKIVYTSNTNI